MYNKLGTAIVFTAGMNIDADGAPGAYHQDSHLGLDNLANAGHAGNWYGLACDAHGRPYVQGAGDPCPGYYVSTTALVDKSKAASDPRRYVDSHLVPYVSIPPELRAEGVHMGDLAMVFYGDRQCAAVVADVGPHGKYGEGSIALASALGIPSSARHGGTGSGVTYVVFAGSSKGWPLALEATQEAAGEAFDAWGGSEQLDDLNVS